MKYLTIFCAKGEKRNISNFIYQDIINELEKSYLENFIIKEEYLNYYCDNNQFLLSVDHQDTDQGIIVISTNYKSHEKGNIRGIEKFLILNNPQDIEQNSSLIKKECLTIPKPSPDISQKQNNQNQSIIDAEDKNKFCKKISKYSLVTTIISIASYLLSTGAQAALMLAVAVVSLLLHIFCALYIENRKAQQSFII